MKRLILSLVCAFSLLIPATLILNPPAVVQGQSSPKVVAITSATSRFMPEYNAETQIGLVAEDLTDATATANTTKLNAALDAMHNGGQFTFTDGTVGPVLRPIRFPAKHFYFKGTILTPIRIGCHITGTGMGIQWTDESWLSYAVYPNNQGGACTRFTRIDGQNGGPVIRVRGLGCIIENIVIMGKRWIGQDQDDPPVPSGTKTPTGIEVEGRSSIPTGWHLFRNLTIGGCTVGISSIPGYYNGALFVSDESHSDNCAVDKVGFTGCDSCYKSTNEQAIAWTFRDIAASVDPQSNPCTVFDMESGGGLHCQNLQLNHNRITVLRVYEWNPHISRYDIHGIRLDGQNEDPATNFVKLFRYDGPCYADSSWLKFKIRMSGDLNNNWNRTPMPDDDPYYDDSNMIDIVNDANADPGTKLPFDDMFFDISSLSADAVNVTTGEFEKISNSPYYRPVRH